MTRMRNEALILPDTLDVGVGRRDYCLGGCGARRWRYLRAHPKVAFISCQSIFGRKTWPHGKPPARHRGLLLDMARARAAA